MGYDYDMRDVTENYKKWGEKSVITSDDFAYVDGLIQRHYDERGRIFDDLLNALKRDADIQSPWSNCCDKGLDLLERLNSGISGKISNGFQGIELSDFYEGEKAAWQRCKTSRVDMTAETIVEIGNNDLEIFKKLEEDLKSAREDEKTIDEVVKATFGQMRDSVRGVAAEAIGIGSSLTAGALDRFAKALAPKATQTAKDFVKGSDVVRELSRKKRAAKDILVRNFDMVNAARDKISDSAVQNLLSQAEGAANEWKGASRGKYQARDLESFAGACREILRDKAARTTERAKSLFYSMQPLYVEAIKSEFKTLYSDPSTIENFQGQLSDETKKMFDELSKEDIAITMLRDSEPKRSAYATMKQIVADVTESVQKLKDAIRETEEQMRAG